MTQNSWSVLHITDLHVANPTGDSELLRSGKYREYLRGLVQEITRHINRVDLVAVTGDFVERGATQHLAHVQEVLDFLLAELELPKNRLVGCVGNHDLILDHEISGDWGAARSDIQKFLNDYANGTARYAEFEQDRAVLCQIEPDLWCLSLDSLWANGGPKRPGPGKIIPGRETDAIMQLVSLVPADAPLVVLSHYPVDPHVGLAAAWEDEDPSWFENHLWSAATPIRERVRRFRTKATTLWLCGDIHREGDRREDLVHHVTTGRIGTETGAADSALYRQAKVIVVSSDPADVENRILRLAYSTSAHRTHAEYGDWHGEWEAGRLANPSQQNPGSDHSGDSPPPLGNVAVQVADVIPAANPEIRFEILDSAIEDVIVSTIRDYDMYMWGRFSTSSEEVLLSWIPVGPLLNAGHLFGTIVKAMSTWLTEQLSCRRTEYQRCLLLGVDCWGAALASQVSVVVGCPNVCIGARGRGQHHAPGEGFDDDVYERVRASSVVVLVIDSVSTGRTLRWIYEQIMSGLSVEESEHIVWLCLTVFRDPLQPPACDLSFIAIEGLACGALRRPFLPANRVPDDALMPPQITLNR